MNKLFALFVIALFVNGGFSQLDIDETDNLEDRYGYIPPRFSGRRPHRRTTRAPSTTTTVASTTISPSTQSPDLRQCIQGCPVTSEYNPVCGTDSTTYTNPGRLYCAQACGIDVSLRRNGPCNSEEQIATTESPDVRQCIQVCPVTPEYNPVCGTDNITYTNPGKLYCAEVCGVDVSLRRTGPCDSAAS